MIKNIVFDFDGTIADSMEAILGIVDNKSEKYGYERLSSKEIKFLMGKGAKYLIANLKIPSYKIPFLLRDIKKELSQLTKDLKTFPGIDVVIRELSGKKFKLGILTTNSKANVEAFLKKNNLEYFDFIYHGSSLFGKDKLLERMIREQKLNKNETVYIGDEDRDIEAAKKVGLISIAVCWGFNSKKLLASEKPDYLITKPSELLSTVSAL